MRRPCGHCGKLVDGYERWSMRLEFRSPDGKRRSHAITLAEVCTACRDLEIRNRRPVTDVGVQTELL